MEEWEGSEEEEEEIQAPSRVPLGPASGDLTNYIELSGCSRLLIEALKKLYGVPNKPENPIEWLRLYFKYASEDVAAAAAASEVIPETESDFSRDLNEIEEMLKTELTEIQKEVICCFEEEEQNNAVIEKLENELTHATLGPSVTNHCHDDFQKYLEHEDDYHYRIRPDPMYQPSKTDMLLERSGTVGGPLMQQSQLGEGGFMGGSLVKHDSIVELVPVDHTFWPVEDIGGLEGLSMGGGMFWREEDNNLWADYPQLYFPERQKQEENEVEEEELSTTIICNDEEEEDEEEEEETLEMDDEEEEMLTESEIGVVGKSETKEGVTGEEEEEYDAGSEGGESEHSLVVTPKTKSPFTPRSAHDKQSKDKKTVEKQKKAKSVKKEKGAAVKTV